MKGILTLFVVLTFMFSCFQAKAATHKENVPLEGQFDQDGPRSIDPTQPVQAFLEEDNVSIEFYKYTPDVTITIKDSNEQVVYTKLCLAPEREIISLAGFASGTYTLELRAGKRGYMYGTFVYANP